MRFFSPAVGYLGIDIGNTSIKLVGLKKEKGEIKLITYGFSEYSKVELNSLEQRISPVSTAKIINKICAKARAEEKNAISALPTFSVFTSILNLSKVDKKDIPAAVHWEAKKVIPLPLEEMILDWKKVEDGLSKKEKSKKEKSDIKMLLTGAPKSLVKRYIDIFRIADINLLSLETETFSLIRSLLGNDKSSVMLVDLGANTTDISIIDNGIPILNRSIDVGGATITKALSERLNIGLSRAEQFKYDLGISMADSRDSEAPIIIKKIISSVVDEIKYADNLFSSKNNKKVEKVVLSGGSALLPNLTGYLSSILDMRVIIGDPWSRISYPLDLKPLLHEIGPRMAVAVGLAMREVG